MSELTKAYIITNNFSPLDILPMPCLFIPGFKIAGNTSAKNIDWNEPLELSIEEGALFSVSPGDVFVGQILGGMVAVRVGDAPGEYNLNPKGRIKVLEILQNVEYFYTIARVKIMDHSVPHKIIKFTPEHLLVAERIQKLCGKIKELAEDFDPDGRINLTYGDLNRFVDMAATQLLVYLVNNPSMSAYKNHIFDLMQQASFLGELDPVRRAKILQKMILQTIFLVNQGRGSGQRVPVESKGGGGSVLKVPTQKTPYDEYKEKIDKLELSEEVLQEVDKELEKLKHMSPASAEYSWTRNYLDWICDLPWSVLTEDNLDLDDIRRILDEDHYGLAKIKNRIEEFLAVKKLNPESRGDILCFIGPPGTGKTSICRSIARAMGRKYVRLSLGGCSDEAKLRGHIRTYVGALPGEIIKGIKKAGSRNPVFVLDEIEKVGKDILKGDPASALLEILDPEQNFSFKDNYLGTPFDLSQVFFIATGNVEETIHPALRDRMEIIYFDPYTLPEKLSIAKRHLIVKQLKDKGLVGDQLSFSDEALENIIRLYTGEAGVRNLERAIANICRKVAGRVARGETGPHEVSPDVLKKFLGAEKYRASKLEKSLGLGVAVGMAVDDRGLGDILFIQVKIIPLGQGDCQLTLTGNLQEVMKESADVALTVAELCINNSYIQKSEEGSVLTGPKKLHIHVPEGAVPKDGPSAGITLVTALASLISNNPVKEKLAMTGEVDIEGNVLSVGGLPAKLDGAKRAGITEIIVPADNRAQVEEISPESKEGLTIHFVEHIKEVLDIAFEEDEN